MWPGMTNKEQTTHIDLFETLCDAEVENISRWNMWPGLTIKNYTLGRACFLQLLEGKISKLIDN